jgi:hypothetical protein
MVSKQAGHNFYISPDLLHTSTEKSCICSWDRKHVPLAVKLARLIQANILLCMSRSDSDEADVQEAHVIHSHTQQQHHGVSSHKPRCTQEYNSFMGVVNLKDQKLQPYKHERKRSTKLYTKSFKRLLDILLLNAFVLSRESQKVKELDHLDFRLKVMKELFEVHTKALKPPCPGRPLKALTPAKLIAGHFIERIPTSEKARAMNEIHNLLQGKQVKRLRNITLV